MTFPLSPAPTHLRTVTFPQRSGVFYVGGAAPSMTLSASGPTAYEVRNYYGAVVSSGAIAGTVVTPTAPAGGWIPGWYRIYFTGVATDATFGPSHGATNFVVIRDDPRFPPMPAGSYSGGMGGGEYRDLATKGVMGLGTSRLSITAANAPTTGESIALIQGELPTAKTYWSAPGAPHGDSRPRPLWTNFPNRAYDVLTLPTNWLNVYAKTPGIDGSQVFVALSAGTSTGSKVTISFPDAATVVETYDNLASSVAAATAINAASAYVQAFTPRSSGTVATQGATAIGRSYYNGVAQAVSALYPDVQYFEGPENEPTPGAETAHKMRLFQAAVHAGNAAAKAIGPCPVDINNLVNWREFLAAGGGAWCDSISFHDYNSHSNGSLPMARNTIPAFLALLAEFGLSGKELWQTEAGAAFTPVYSVYHPRRARVKLLHTLVWEQYRVPRERNSYWYDRSHGFWAFPTWWQNTDLSLNPDAVLHRTLAEETWGKPFEAALSFGTIGDRIFLGNVYGGVGGRTVALIATSCLPGATITLTLTGAPATVVVVDGFGVESTMAVAGGRVTVPVSDTGTYVRLPAGVTASAYSCNDWPPAALAAAWPSSGVAATGSIGGRPSSVLANNGWPSSYGDGVGVAASTATTPDTAALEWPSSTRVDRLIIWAGQSWQSSGTLVDFDVQTSTNGTTWTTRATVTRPTPSSFVHGTDFRNVGCTRETYWDEQWVFDVPLPAPVACKFVRLNVRATSYGGEPDAAAVTVGGQGDNAQHVVIQEIAVLCDANTRKQYVTT